jgi:hypothetical protein
VPISHRTAVGLLSVTSSAPIGQRSCYARSSRACHCHARLTNSTRYLQTAGTEGPTTRQRRPSRRPRSTRGSRYPVVARSTAKSALTGFIFDPTHSSVPAMAAGSVPTAPNAQARVSRRTRLAASTTSLGKVSHLTESAKSANFLLLSYLRPPRRGLNSRNDDPHLPSRNIRKHPLVQGKHAVACCLHSARITPGTRRLRGVPQKTLRPKGH